MTQACMCAKHLTSSDGLLALNLPGPASRFSAPWQWPMPSPRSSGGSAGACTAIQALTRHSLRAQWVCSAGPSSADPGRVDSQASLKKQYSLLCASPARRALEPGAARCLYHLSSVTSLACSSFFWNFPLPWVNLSALYRRCSRRAQYCLQVRGVDHHQCAVVWQQALAWTLLCAGNTLHAA